MESMYDRIKKLRNHLGWSQEELAKKVGYADKTSIAKIEAGKVDLPQSKIMAFSMALNTTPSFLMDGEDEPKYRKKGKKGVLIPVVGIVPAGIPIEACEDILDWDEIPEDMARMGEHFGLKIKGHSMDPRISDGDIVIVRIQSDADSGSIVIARIGSDEEVTCKKMLKSKDGVTLMPFNPTYEPLYYSNDEVRSLPVTIIGRVVEQRRKF